MPEFVFAIDEATCIECGSCRRYCPVPNTIIIDAEYQHTIDPNICTGCGLCEAFCPLPNTIFKVPQVEAQSKERLKALRRSLWRNKWHYADHPIMGPITLDAKQELRELDLADHQPGSTQLMQQINP